MIRAAIKFQNSMVVVLDKDGEQLSKYQGRYEDVKESILKDAPPGAVFGHWFDDEISIRKVLREEW